MLFKEDKKDTFRSRLRAIDFDVRENVIFRTLCRDIKVASRVEGRGVGRGKGLVLCRISGIILKAAFASKGIKGLCRKVIFSARSFLITT